MGDPVELEQLFLHLLVSACERSPGGGLIHVGSANLTDVLEVRVQDSGLGLVSLESTDASAGGEPAEAAGAVAAAARAGGAGGRRFSPGLGLTISRNIVSRHGGAIRIDSELSKGTTVTMRFPLVDRKHRSRWAVPTSTRVPGSALALAEPGRPVVVLAGDAESAAPWTASLEAQGLKVIVQTGPVPAYEDVEARRPRVVVVDSGLAESGRGDWLSLLKRLSDERIAPAVVLLADQHQRQLLVALDSGASFRVLVKPASAEQIVQAVLLADLETTSLEVRV
jgi:CheY-like chemotaxis protein